jgi:hypothetical protein
MPRSCRLLLVLCALGLAACRAEPPQIVSFTATPLQLKTGEATTFKWSVKGATRVNLRDPSGTVTDGLAAGDGQLEVVPAGSGSWTLIAYNKEIAQSAAVTLTVTGGPKIINFTATPTVLTPGQPATLSWVTETAAAVSISDGAQNLPVEPTMTSGQFSVSPTATTTYTLTAQGAGGAAATASVTIELPVAPSVVSFTATPGNVNPGQPVTLAWSVSAASEVAIKKSTGNALSLGAKAQLAQGSYDVKPDRSDTYTLTASGAGGTATQQVAVAVQPVITTFDSTPPGADPVDPYTLGWTTHSAVRLRLLKNTTQVLLDTTDLAVADSGTFNEPAPGAVTSNMYELELTSLEGVKISKFVTVAVGPKPVISAFSVTPTSTTVGRTFTVAWQTSGAASLSIKLNGTSATTLTAATRLANGTWTSPAQTVAGPVTVDLVAKSAVLSQAVQSATVTVYEAPAVTAFTATPSTVAAAGDAVSLAWAVTGASSAALLAGAGTVASAAIPSGSLGVRPLASGLYTLRAYNLAGDFTDRTVNVTVTAAAAAALTVTPSPFIPGEELTATWNVTTAGATAPRLSPAPYEVRADVLTDIATTGTALALPAADDSVATLTFPAGFTFDVGPGVAAATSAQVSTNGFLSLSPSWTDASPTNLPANDPASPPLLVAPLWDDLLLPTPEVRWQLLDADTLAVQWTAAQFRTGASAAAGSATFQAVLHRDGTVDFRYGTLTPPGGEPTRAQGSSATVAIGGARQTWASEFSVNTPRLSGVAAVHFFSGPVGLAGTGKLRPSASVDVNLVALDAASTPLLAQARAAALIPGTVLVNEVLPIPAAAVDPALGEWLELRNASNVPLDLSGVVLATGAGTFALPSGTTLPASGLLVLGNTANTMVNGGVSVAVPWGSAVGLPDSAGTASFTLRGQALASLSWGGASPTPVAGSSVRRDQVATFGASALPAAMVCLDATPTPGAANGGCSYDVTLNTLGVLDISATGQDVTPVPSTSGDWRVQVDFATLSGAAPAFTFPYFGTSFTRADLSSNGWLSLFNTATTPNTSSAPTPKPLPTAATPNAVIAPFWDDLSTSRATGTPPAKLWVELQGTSPDRTLIIEWSRFDLPATVVDADLTFEVLLHETTGQVEMRWGSLFAGDAGARAMGAEAVVGLEDPTGQIGIPLATPLTPTSGVSFTRP